MLIVGLRRFKELTMGPDWFTSLTITSFLVKISNRSLLALVLCLARLWIVRDARIGGILFPLGI